MTLAFQPARTSWSPLTNGLAFLTGRGPDSLDRPHQNAVTALLCVCHSLFALFLRLASFVFNHFPPLFAKTGGWGIPHVAPCASEVLCLPQVRPGEDANVGRQFRLSALRLGASARGAAFGGA